MGRIASVSLVLSLLMVAGVGVMGAGCGGGGSGGTGGGNGGTGGIAGSGNGGSGGETGGSGGTDLCANGEQDPGECGPDCGGVCHARCGGGVTCCTDDDCKSGTCDPDTKKCAITCSDHEKNGAETDVDCGGDCPAKCANDKHCLTQDDCTSNSCVAVGSDFLCKDPTCSDGQKNQDEGDKDCGGMVAMCKLCPPNSTCNRNADCDSGNCPAGFCKAPTCADSIQNQGESDKDCGGATTCDRCDDGKACTGPSDCKSNICSGNKVCVPPSCTDGVVNQDETDKDCGGTKCPNRCPDNDACKIDSDCADKVCVLNHCTAPTCVDLHQNGKETDVDCGGADASGGCPPCDANLHCVNPGDCKSKNCTGGVCQPVSCTDNIQNGDEGAVDCGGSDPKCPRCADHSPCLQDNDCLDKVCVVNTCAPPQCNDMAANGTETGVDCGGPVSGDACMTNMDCHQGQTCQGGKCGCPRCPANQGCSDPSDCVTLWCPPMPGGICKVPPCENGKIEGNEQCDDGNSNDTDDCSNTCTLPTCGDGIVQVIGTKAAYQGKRSWSAAFDDTTPMYFLNLDRVRGRVYDKGAKCAADKCDLKDTDEVSEHAMCQALGYGMATHVDWTGSDGVLDQVMLRAANWSCSADLDKAGNHLGFTCAAGADLLTIPPTQPPAPPGNMLKALSCQGEQCDDGSKNSDVNADACRSNCSKAHCGDGVKDTGEDCDDGDPASGGTNSDSTPDACRMNCKSAHCGDGVVDKGEACDDGNNIDNVPPVNGCKSDCSGPG